MAIKIVKISGGLGNQMFCYAFACALQKCGHKVYVDTSLYRKATVHSGIDFCHNGLETERLFGIKFDEADTADVRRLSTSAEGLLNRIRRKYFTKKTHYIDTVFKYTPELLSDKNDCYLEGYWQTEKYFLPIEKDIRRLFTFRPTLSEKSAAVQSALQAQQAAVLSASIHVRRGDFLNTKTLNVCTETYYNNAIKYAVKKHAVSRFYIFSDDIPWCREHLCFCNAHAVFIDWNTGNDSWQDMALMSMCRCNIIANSSFSWWAAWLNNASDKTVLAPAIWNRRQLEYVDRYYGYDYSDIVPESWIRIPID
ncbi:alpha-1,2-fucosyltransferase [Treponema lecithinolyticum]|uniref:Glycosyltransferase, family 11 n=1 Tax=Treponema lecithinolyticum ATCC 700332 TaxID=1321815 RepID=A0ABN0P1U7_TRELE|nr:alpha-1,2-fucosyltransferase [Treponema lecithinolyticum]ERJ94496.1 glycosyltransferase, family 11 [Treponema lecithinolyticum ATCC 700332]